MWAVLQLGRSVVPLLSGCDLSPIYVVDVGGGRAPRFCSSCDMPSLERAFVSSGRWSKSAVVVASCRAEDVVQVDVDDVQEVLEICLEVGVGPSLLLEDLIVVVIINAPC